MRFTGELGEHLGRNFLHGHAELVESRNLMAGNFDSHLGIKKIWLFEASPYVSIGSHTFAMFVHNGVG